MTLGVDPCMDRRALWTAVLAGSVSAALVGWFVWSFADRKLREELGQAGPGLNAAVERALETQIRPQVRQEIVNTLASQGITRERVDRAVAALDSLRALGVNV